MLESNIKRLFSKIVCKTTAKPKASLSAVLSDLSEKQEQLLNREYENQVFLIQYLEDKIAQLEGRIENNIFLSNICNLYLQQYYSKKESQPLQEHFVSYYYDAPSNIVNLGDYIQTIATEKAIRRCLKNAYVRFEPVLRSKLTSHNGGVCVMQGWYEHKQLTFLPGPDTRPVWVGTHFSRVARMLLQTLYKSSPIRFDDIGCRDRSTLLFCQSMGIPSYFSRCLTLTLPRRTELQSQQSNRIYIIDCCEEIINNLPLKIKNNAIYKTQRNVTIEHVYDTKECRAKAEQMLEEYKNHASLIITTALHCAQPCVAMGIPVVFINPNYDEEERFSSMDGILPIYTLEDLKNNRIIYPDTAPDIEDLKVLLLKNLELSIKETISEEERQLRYEIRRKIESYKIK